MVGAAQAADMIPDIWHWKWKNGYPKNHDFSKGFLGNIPSKEIATSIVAIPNLAKYPFIYFHANQYAKKHVASLYNERRNAKVTRKYITKCIYLRINAFM